MRRTRTARGKWERTHPAGEPIPAAKLASLLGLRMSRETARSLLDEVYGIKTAPVVTLTRAAR